MDFNFTEEQQLLADTVKRFVRDDYTFETRRDILKTPAGWSRDVWKSLADLGLTALNVPEAHGGLNASPVDTRLVMNALGEGLVVEPFLSGAVLAPALISRLDDEKAATELFEGIVSGDRIVIVAHQEANTRGEIQYVATKAEKSADGYVLDGLKAVVAHGGAADELLVTARTSGQPGDANGISVFRVDPKATGVTAVLPGFPAGTRALGGQFIKGQVTHDIVYSLSLPWGVTIDAAVLNIFDKDPSFVRSDLSYDPFSGSPLGRQFRFGVTKKF